MKRTLAVFAAAAFVLLGLGGTASAQHDGGSYAWVSCGSDGDYTGCIAEAGNTGHEHCSEYWTKADCSAGCVGNGFVAGDDCKQHGNGITTPGNLDGGKGDGGSGGGHGGGDGIGPDVGGKGPGGGLAVTGSEAASMALLGAGLVGVGGLAIVSAKRRETNAS